MSALTASPLAARRPATITAASVLMILLGLSAPLVFLGGAEVPQTVVVVGSILAALKIGSGIGVWLCRKWAAILGFVIVLLDALLSVPGALGEGGDIAQIYVIAGLIASVAVLVLLVLPAARRAYR